MAMVGCQLHAHGEEPTPCHGGTQTTCPRWDAGICYLPAPVHSLLEGPRQTELGIQGEELLFKIN